MNRCQEKECDQRMQNETRTGDEISVPVMPKAYQYEATAKQAMVGKHKQMFILKDNKAYTEAHRVELVKWIEG